MVVAVPLLNVRGYGRKRKGTPVKVFVPDSGEGTGQGKGAANIVTTVETNDTLPHKLHKVSHVSKASSYAPFPAHALPETLQTLHEASRHASPPAPNCRIREVHCGNQVTLVVIAIRDITKGEEITVDYSLIEWGENLEFRRGLSPGQLESSSGPDNNTIKKEDEPLPLTVQQQEQVYVSSSWTSSAAHSNDSVSEREENNPSPRGPLLQKKPGSTPPKKKSCHRTPPGRTHLSQCISSSDAPPQQQPSSPCKSAFKAPDILSGRNCVTQTCFYCGRHFRSLRHHLDKHHAHQPDVCAALVERFSQMPCLQAQSPHPGDNPTNPQAHAKLTRVQDLSPHSTDLTTANHPPLDSLSSSQSAVIVRVIDQNPPPTAVEGLTKGGKKRSKTVLQNEEEEPVRSGLKADNDENVCVENSSGDATEPMKLKLEDTFDSDAENDIREVECDSGTEDKEKMSSSSGRVQMLPLLSTLGSLVLYLRRLQHSAFLSLSRQPQSAEAWRLLCHSSLVLLILYNRRRECEVSKLSISEYQARVTPQNPVPVPPGAPPALTPLEASLSPFERLVLTHLPRVGVQGKRGRVQPLILPPHSEPCLELLLQTRHGVGVDPANPYVFARPYHSPATPLRGTELLRSLARSSGMPNPRTLTHTRVRRQVGILTQLLLLGEGEASVVERLECFLEREYHVTQSCVDITQDAGLMARVGRVVLCGERDGVLFRGMSLHHICLELDVMSQNSADSNSERESDGETAASNLPNVKKTKGKVRPKRPKDTKPLLPLSPSLIPLSPGSRRGTGKRGVLKRPWSEAERAAVEEHLNQNISELRVPAKAECERCLQNSPLLVNNHRDWRAIKFYCHNRIQLLKKLQRQESQPLPVC
uniref:SET domain-containing protein n=1 Tax=Knipowitschia caucasica TaxID=637954 RepID=A0AAV2LG71_KNICA